MGERSFQLLWLGQTIANAGGWISVGVLPVLMYQLTGSAAQTALVATVQAAPYLLFGLYAGAIADRSNRRTIIVGCDLASATAIASIPAWGLVSLLTRINQITLRQQLTPDRLHGRVNVTVRMINYSGTPLGAAVGGIAGQLDVRAALLIMAALLAATAVYACTSPLRRIDRATITRMLQEAEQARSGS